MEKQKGKRINFRRQVSAINMGEKVVLEYMNPNSLYFQGEEKGIDGNVCHIQSNVADMSWVRYMRQFNITDVVMS